MPSKAKSKPKASKASKKQKPNQKNHEGMVLRSHLIEQISESRLSHHAKPSKGVSKGKKAPAKKQSNKTPSKTGLILQNQPQRSPLKAERTQQMLDYFESEQEQVKRQHKSPKQMHQMVRRSKMHISEIELQSSSSNAETTKNEVTTHHTSNPAKDILPLFPKIKLHHQELPAPRGKSMEEDIAQRLRDLKFVSFKELRLGCQQELIFAAYFEETESKQECVVDFTSEELTLLGKTLGADLKLDFLDAYLTEHAQTI